MDALIVLSHVEISVVCDYYKKTCFSQECFCPKQTIRFMYLDVIELIKGCAMKLNLYRYIHHKNMQTQTQKVY